MAFGKKSDSLKSLKKSLKKGSASFIKFIPAEGMTVRFLEEPEEWVMYKSVYDPTLRKSWPMPDEGMPGSDADSGDVSTRYLANVVDIESDRVVPLQMPKSLVNALVVRYEKYDTLLDRDYELFKSGKGLDTTYGLTPEPASKMKLSKYTLLDLEEVLEAAYNDVFGDADDDDVDDDDDEEVTPAKKPSKKSAPSKAKAKPKKAVVEEDEDDDDDFDDEDDDDIEDDIEEDDDDNDEDDDLEDDDIDDDDDDDLEDDDDEFWTEDELNALPVGQLRTIARDYGIKTTGMKKGELVAAIMEDDEF